MVAVKLENYINEKEISLPRTPDEYISWFEEKLKITKEFREELKIQCILHKGIAKYFYEELFPLYCLLKNKSKAWEKNKFIPIVGNQNFDVRVDPGRNGIPQYIEIVAADRNESEHARMEYFLAHGSVNSIGEVSITREKRNGKKISVDEEAYSSEEINQRVKDRISELINKKITVKERPDNTALLVSFCDYAAFRYDKDSSKVEMNTFLDTLNIQWQIRYLALYAVGMSGQSFYERIRIDNGR